MLDFGDEQLGTFSVSGEWVCGGLFAFSGDFGNHRSRTRDAESAQPLRVILNSVVIIKCEIQCRPSYKRVITLLNIIYLTASYITWIHVHCDRACAPTQLSIPQIQIRMIITET